MFLYLLTINYLLPISNMLCFVLQALSDIQIAMKVVHSTGESDEHPLDTQYRSLHCKLQPLDSSSDEFKVCVALHITDEWGSR